MAEPAVPPGWTPERATRLGVKVIAAVALLPIAFVGFFLWAALGDEENASSVHGAIVVVIVLGIVVVGGTVATLVGLRAARRTDS